jgi:hypothetical protein
LLCFVYCWLICPGLYALLCLVWSCSARQTVVLLMPYIRVGIFFFLSSSSLQKFFYFIYLFIYLLIYLCYIYLCFCFSIVCVFRICLAFLTCVSRFWVPRRSSLSVHFAKAATTADMLCQSLLIGVTIGFMSQSPIVSVRLPSSHTLTPLSCFDLFYLGISIFCFTYMHPPEYLDSRSYQAPT